MIESFLIKNEIPFIKEILLKNYTTMGIGGCVPYLISPRSIEENLEIALFLQKNSIKYKIIGGGSNIIADDKNYTTPVISLDHLKKISINKKNSIESSAGLPLSHLCSFATTNSLTGLEWLVGIPGTVGGAVKMNAGAFHNEIKDTIESVTLLDSYHTIVKITRDELTFAYRKSFLNPNDIVLETEFTCMPENPALIHQKLELFQNHRLHTQPLTEKSAGCIFKNPPGISAGKLIDQLGLTGFRIGGAVISEKHANFIVNRHNAVFSDILQLIDYIKDKVAENYHCELENEVELWYAQ